MGGDGALGRHGVGGVGGVALLLHRVARDEARHLSLGVLRDMNVLSGAGSLLHRNIDDEECDSPKKFAFSYVKHESDCVFCDKKKDIDGIGHCSDKTVTRIFKSSIEM